MLAAYLDDILIKWENSNQHCEHIKEMFRGSMITILSSVLNSVNFLCPKLNIWIDAKGWTPDQERAEAIKIMPVPNNMTKLQAFLGLANYYGISITNMQNLRSPLNNLFKKGVKWDCERAFEKILKNFNFRFIFSSFKLEKRNCSWIWRQLLLNWCGNFA